MSAGERNPSSAPLGASASAVRVSERSSTRACVARWITSKRSSGAILSQASLASARVRTSEPPPAYRATVRTSSPLPFSLGNPPAAANAER